MGTFRAGWVNKTVTMSAELKQWVDDTAFEHKHKYKSLVFLWAAVKAGYKPNELEKEKLKHYNYVK